MGAGEYDATQERGEVRGASNQHIAASNPEVAGVADIGLTHKDGYHPGGNPSCRCRRGQAGGPRYFILVGARALVGRGFRQRAGRSVQAATGCSRATIAKIAKRLKPAA